MIEAERHQAILELLRAQGHCDVHRLVQRLAVSEPTVRRDLSKLARAGRIERVRGGAVLLQADEADCFDPHRQAAALPAKRQLAAAAAALCEDGDTIAIDAGSTTYQMGACLVGRELTVLTNAFPLAQRLMAETNCRVILAPGEIDRQRGAVLDPFDRDFFADYTCNRLFLSAQSCDAMGVHNDDRAVIRSEQQLLRIAREVVLLVDSRKFRRRGTLRLCEWGAVDLCLCDADIRDEDRRLLDGQGVRYQVVAAD